jgi:putative transcriptional regulator
VARIRVQLPEARARRRLSQRQLAALAGVRPDTVSALERGESAGIRFDTLAGLCEVLDCEPGDLLAVERDTHRLPVLGGPDEDTVVEARLKHTGRRVDGPSFVAELLRASGRPNGRANA